MLDNGTKKRIDSARDILVCKAPNPKSQVEQITIAMIYKFMDDMNNETEELEGKAATPKNPYAALGGEKIAKENQYLLLDDINL
jgi:type I restriction enzyme M protein